MRKTLLGAALCLGTVLGASAGTVVAGEVTGQGRGTPLLVEAGPQDRVGNAVVNPSHCAFSGLEDNDGAGVTPGVTQTPADGPFPGVARYGCRGPADGNVDRP